MDSEYKRREVDRLGGIEGTDAGALGLDGPPASAPPGATVDDSQHLVPGADFGLSPADEEKPWFTSLAFESDQAGVGEDPPDVQSPMDAAGTPEPD